MIRQCEAVAREWLASPVYDEATKAEVRRMLGSEDKTELVDSFYRSLEFGTGGLRGIMGAGTNRMNIYTVGAATQGLANYLHKSFAEREQISVCIGYDCRNNSELFAQTSARILSANGIRVYLFDDMRPTPEMSFAIRKLGCQSGIILTASHNPKEYNGYKAYWDDGAQVLAPHDAGIIEEVGRVKPEDIRFEGNEELVTIIGEEIDRAYLEAVHGISIDPECISRQADLSIVYTPIHGTGMKLVPRSLELWGFKNVHCVAEQMIKDGNFPTVVSPNPENAEALTLALNLARQIDADIVMASDPDADRVGMACKNTKGEWVLINGNQTCLLFLYYIIKNRKAKGGMRGNEFVVKTIVTTELIAEIAKREGVELLDCYTGFKWIAREIRLREGMKQYIGGGEESYGFLAEDFVRDKDAVSACSLLAEICAWAKDRGKTLYDVLLDIYREYGFAYNKTVNVVKPGKSGADEIRAMMEGFHAAPLQKLGDEAVVCTRDFKTLKETTADGEERRIDMPAPSDVVQWFGAKGTKVSVRPSGTEPKIKFYIETRSELGETDAIEEAVKAAEAKVGAISEALLAARE